MMEDLGDKGLDDEIQERLDEINSVLKSWVDVKQKILLSKFAAQGNKECRRKKGAGKFRFDIFKHVKEWSVVQTKLSWPKQVSFYQPYFPIKQNLHFLEKMDWMQLALPGIFEKVPHPMKFDRQDDFYPEEYVDERDSKLHILVQKFFRKYKRVDMLSINCIALYLGVKVSIVIRYFMRALKEQLYNDEVQEVQRAQKISDEFLARKDRYREIFGSEVFSMVRDDELAMMMKDKGGCRPFLQTQYFCKNCQEFFCFDHLLPEHMKDFYFTADDSEYSEYKSNMFEQMKNPVGEIERLQQANTSPKYQVCCAKGSKDCWLNLTETKELLSLNSMLIPESELPAARTLVMIAMNNGIKNSCYLQLVVPNLTCIQIHLLIKQVQLTEFGTSKQTLIPSPFIPPTKKSKKGYKKKRPDLAKGLRSRMDLDRSQFASIFGEDFAFPIHPLNCLMQKNRVLLGQSQICPGLGLFAGQDFEKDQLICIYLGEILEELDSDDLRNKVNNLYGTSYVFALGERSSYNIDSLVYGNKSRMVNHNEGNKFNNCIIENKPINEMEYILFKASKQISMGEELFFDYGDSYTLEWKSIYKIMVQYFNGIETKKKNSQKSKKDVERVRKMFTPS
jgi:hypothetical protein